MLITLAADIEHAQTTEKRKIRLNSGLHGPDAELPELLTILLAVQNGSPELMRIEVRGDLWQAFKCQWSKYNAAVYAVKGERQRYEINMVVLHTLFEQIPDNLGERH